MKACDFRSSRPQLPLFRPENLAGGEHWEMEPRPEAVCFRGQTLAMLKHFFELSSQVGRLPSLLGREFFRARVSHHAVPSFEEQVVFVRDIELCLGRLRQRHAEVITLMGLYSFSREEAARLLQCPPSWVRQQFAEALDALGEIFLRAGLLREDKPDRRQRQVFTRGVPAEIGESRAAAEAAQFGAADASRKTVGRAESGVVEAGAAMA